MGWRQNTAEIIAMGKQLLDLRASTKHGEWIPLLRQMGIHDGTALNYMNIAKMFGDDPRIAEMPVSELYLLVHRTRANPTAFEKAACKIESAAQQSEKNLERLIVQSLRSQGIPVEIQVNCGVGVADLVTPEAIYEIKVALSRKRLFQAIGQVLIYRQAIDPSRRAIVAGYIDPSSNVLDILQYASQIGVEVILVE